MPKSSDSILLQAIRASTESVVVTDARQPDNPIVFVNPAFERLTGYRNDEIVGQNCRFLQGTDRDQDARRALKGAVIMGEECRAVIRNYRKDGTMFLNELRVTPVYDKAGTPRFFLGIQHEISQRNA